MVFDSEHKCSQLGFILLFLSFSSLLQSLIMLISAHSSSLLSVYHFLHPDVYVLKQIVGFAFSLDNTVTSVFRFCCCCCFQVCAAIYGAITEIELIEKRCFSERL